jgi:hypothetical protein
VAYPASRVCAALFGVGRSLARGAATWESNLAAALNLLQGFVNLDVALEYVSQELRQIDALLFGFSGEVFPDAALDRSRQEDLCPKRNVVQTADSFAEVNL